MTKILTAARVYSGAIVIAMCGIAVELALRDWPGAIVCGVLVLSAFIGRAVRVLWFAVGLLVLAFAVVSHTWLAIPAALLYSLSNVLALQERGHAYSSDELVRSAVEGRHLVAALPAANVVRYGQLVSSLSLLHAAIAADPHRWGSVAVIGPGELSPEGGELADTGWTVTASEAAHVARYLPRVGSDLDVHNLAIAAILLPHSNAHRAVPRDIGFVRAAESVGGMSTAAMVRAMSEASKGPAGAHLRERFDALHELARTARSPQAAPSAGTAAYPTAPATSVATSATSRPATSAAPRATPRQESAKSKSPSTRPPARRPASRQRRKRLRDSVMMSAWRPSAMVLWWGVRPLSTMLAFAACLWALSAGVNPVLAGCAAAAVVLVRPTRRVWMAVPVAVLCAWVSPWAAAMVGLRAAATVSAVLLNGQGWDTGLSRLVEARRVVAGGTDLDTAWSVAAAGFARPQDLAVLEAVLGVLAAAWCQADGLILGRETCRVTRGLLFNKWPAGSAISAEPSAEKLILQMVIAESIGSHFFQALAMGIAIPIGVFMPDIASLHVAGYDVARPIVIIIGIIAAWRSANGQAHDEHARRVAAARNLGSPYLIIGARALQASGVAAVLVTGGIMALVLHVGAMLALLAAVAAGGLAWFTRRKVLRPRLAPTEVVPRLPVSLRWHRGHDVWNAARAALINGDAAAAERIWRQLVSGRTPAQGQIRALSKAMLADIALTHGDWQESVQWADAAVSEARADSAACYLTRSIAARVLLAAGNPARSVELLDEVERAGHGRRMRRDPVTRIARARALAMTGDVARAKGILSQVRGGPRGSVFGPLIESEALVATMASPRELPAAAERLRSMINWVEDALQRDASGRLPDAERLGKAAARAWLALGDLELRLGKTESAETVLLRAINELQAPDDMANRAIAQILFGCALTARRRDADSLDPIANGLSTLESARGQLRDSRLRSQLVLRLDDVYTRALDALIAQQEWLPAAGEVAALLLESVRRGALASLLHESGRLRLSAETLAIQREIIQLERQGVGSGERESELAALRARLSDAMTSLYAEAYAPQTVTMPDLRHRAAGAHILTFRVTQADGTALRGHSVWVAPGRDPMITAVAVTEPRHLAAVGLHDRKAQRETLQASQWAGDAEYVRWQGLGALLLPPPLLAQLARAVRERPLRVLVVPDGPLAAFPWAGLRLPDGRHLVEVAVIQVVPVMNLIDDHGTQTEDASAAGRDQIALYRNEEARPDLPGSLARIGTVQEAKSSTEIEQLLGAGGIGGAYFAVHGEGDGLGQHVKLAGGGTISAASALAMRWPPWLIFASCLVGNVLIKAGAEPTGLITSCLLGGTSSVIAGVVEVHSGAAELVCVPVATHLANGIHPADALRLAQLAYIEDRDTASVHRWAGYICISRRQPLTTRMEIIG